ncbi:Mov34/MPN/PAD-1 family protein [Arthrobacter sp. FW305-BF8]|uniref:Mov34/MPN/PAD-1 family protein n=1 Tax=Arthrobacter sp. FW305-BF8 TaxID=2879617 RepID=UPI003FA40E04|nr:Mov34/MPN/PAD-1 family protein [Arthrobacter sp. FW305-BF8]
MPASASWCFSCFEWARSGNPQLQPPASAGPLNQPIGCAEPTFAGPAYNLNEVSLHAARPQHSGKKLQQAPHWRRAAFCPVGVSPGHTCVTNEVGPGPGASHNKASFNPDADWQSHQIARLYADSGRRLAYLGDWHTHPGAFPTPGARDLETLQAIARHSPARCPEPIMVIIGQPYGFGRSEFEFTVTDTYWAPDPWDVPGRMT